MARPGSSARLTAPTTATPWTPAASTSGTRSRVIPAMAITGTLTAFATAPTAVGAEGGREAALGRRGVGRAHPEVVGPLGDPGPAGRDVAGGGPDDRLVPEEATGDVDRQVVVAEVDPVGAGGQGDVDSVVDEAGGAGDPAAHDDGLGQGEEGPVGQGLGPDLDDRGPGGEGGVDRDEGISGGIEVGQHLEPTDHLAQRALPPPV